jgi:hypothetical protein
MPKTYDRCVKHVKAKGHSLSSSHAICQVSVMKNGKKGKKKTKA